MGCDWKKCFNCGRIGYSGAWVNGRDYNYEEWMCDDCEDCENIAEIVDVKNKLEKEIERFINMNEELRSLKNKLERLQNF
jgi:hypothetical protein